MTSGGLASIHHQHVAVDIGRGVRSQKNRRAFQIVVIAESSERNLFQELLFDQCAPIVHSICFVKLLDFLKIRFVVAAEGLGAKRLPHSDSARTWPTTRVRSGIPCRRQ